MNIFVYKMKFLYIWISILYLDIDTCVYYVKFFWSENLDHSRFLDEKFWNVVTPLGIHGNHLSLQNRHPLDVLTQNIVQKFWTFGEKSRKTLKNGQKWPPTMSARNMLNNFSKYASHSRDCPESGRFYWVLNFGSH